jgi:SAM-dependent methyltransferase
MDPARRAWRRVLHGSTVARLTAYHYVDAVTPRADVGAALRGFPRYIRDRRRYEELSGEELSRYDDNPQLRDWTPTTPFDPHYTYQDAWAARAVHDRAPAEHVDVGSRITYVMGLAAFVRVVFIDLRPLEVTFPNVESRVGTVLEMPFEDATVESLSCLHVAEHIGLGRYGDPLDPEGTKKAAAELARVLAPGGQLLFSIPVGRPRTAFNAHRVHDPRAVPGMFPGLSLDSFAGVDDAGRFHAELGPEDLAGSDWGCGFYRFVR